ncbi:hypothetical protein THRCLA_23026, partial [Thraustotheca clavata]
MQAEDKYTLTKVKLKEPSFTKLHVVVNAVGFLFSIVIVILVGIDTIANNWAVNDYIGNGHRFITPVASVNTAADLPSQYSFDVKRGINDMSRIGIWMLNYTIQVLSNPATD